MKPEVDHARQVACFVGGRMIEGRSIPDIVKEMDAILASIRREYAIESISVSISPIYLMWKVAADALRKRC